MTKKQQIAVSLALFVGMSAMPAVSWAGEHGGTAIGGGKEHGGAAVSAEGSQGMPEADEAALLKEAAAALRKGETRPDLAEKLEKLSQE